VPYHIYHTVLNATNYNVPQNRERVFIIGIRDDKDNNFTWTKKKPLIKRLYNCLEREVAEKYLLGQKMIDGLMKEKSNFKGRFKPKTLLDDIANCVTTREGYRCTDNFIKIGYINQDSQASQVFSDKGVCPTLSAGTHGYANGYVQTSIPVLTQDNHGIYDGNLIRRLTPRECFRLMDFPDSYKIIVSDTQAYKQAGNSIVKNVLAAIISKLNL